MPVRDDQDFERKRQQIIDGALHVFARKGFEKATNKDIAEEAGIGSPGLIYHYFKDKGDLLRQVIEQRVPALQVINRGDAFMDLPPREALTLFGNAFLAMLNNRATIALVKLMLGESLRQPTIAGMINQIGPLRGLTFLSRYLAHQMDIGTLRRMDPAAAARCFIGPVIAYIFTREVFVQPDVQTLSPETMLASTIDIFLQGMEIRVGGRETRD